METLTKTKKKPHITFFRSKGLTWFYATRDGLRTHFYATPEIAEQAWNEGERIPTSRMNLGK